MACLEPASDDLAVIIDWSDFSYVDHCDGVPVVGGQTELTTVQERVVGSACGTGVLRADDVVGPGPDGFLVATSYRARSAAVQNGFEGILSRRPPVANGNFHFGLLNNRAPALFSSSSSTSAAALPLEVIHHLAFQATPGTDAFTVQLLSSGARIATTVGTMTFAPATDILDVSVGDDPVGFPRNNAFPVDELLVAAGPRQERFIRTYHRALDGLVLSPTRPTEVDVRLAPWVLTSSAPQAHPPARLDDDGLILTADAGVFSQAFLPLPVASNQAVYRVKLSTVDDQPWPARVRVELLPITASQPRITVIVVDGVSLLLPVNGATVTSATWTAASTLEVELQISSRSFSALTAGGTATWALPPRATWPQGGSIHPTEARLLVQAQGGEVRLERVVANAVTP